LKKGTDEVGSEIIHWLEVKNIKTGKIERVTNQHLFIWETISLGDGQICNYK
jgi:hypothetical protein